MITSTKKWPRKGKVAVAKAAKGRKSAKALAEAKDRAERRKVGKTLDLAAYMADFQRDTASAAYWETKE